MSNIIWTLISFAALCNILEFCTSIYPGTGIHPQPCQSNQMCCASGHHMSYVSYSVYQTNSAMYRTSAVVTPSFCSPHVNVLFLPAFENRSPASRSQRCTNEQQTAVNEWWVVNDVVFKSPWSCFSEFYTVKVLLFFSPQEAQPRIVRWTCKRKKKSAGSLLVSNQIQASFTWGSKSDISQLVCGQTDFPQRCESLRTRQRHILTSWLCTLIRTSMVIRNHILWFTLKSTVKEKKSTKATNVNGLRAVV